jgi:hypothetical protein
VNIKYCMAAPTFFPCDNCGDPRLTARSMEFLDLLYPVIISVFIAVSSVVFAYVLQQQEDYITASTLL